MSIGSVAHKIVDGIHHLFVQGKHDVEQVKVFIDARPGLKHDLDTLLGPVKDAVETEVKAKLAELQQSNPQQAVSLVKAEIPTIISTVKNAFLGQVSHTGSLDLILSLATNTVLALIEPQAQS